MWFEVALLTTIFAVGNILFGHFEECTPKWRRISKLVLFIAVTIFITEILGRIWFYVMLGCCAIGGLVIHGWWLPKHGINGWTGEPKEKYYELRGWKLLKTSTTYSQNHVDTTQLQE